MFSKKKKIITTKNLKVRCHFLYTFFREQTLSINIWCFSFSFYNYMMISCIQYIRNILASYSVYILWYPNNSICMPVKDFLEILRKSKGHSIDSHMKHLISSRLVWQWVFQNVGQFLGPNSSLDLQLCKMRDFHDKDTRFMVQCVSTENQQSDGVWKCLWFYFSRLSWVYDEWDEF